MPISTTVAAQIRKEEAQKKAQDFAKYNQNNIDSALIKEHKYKVGPYNEQEATFFVEELATIYKPLNWHVYGSPDKSTDNWWVNIVDAAEFKAVQDAQYRVDMWHGFLCFITLLGLLFFAFMIVMR